MSKKEERRKPTFPKYHNFKIQRRTPYQLRRQLKKIDFASRKILAAPPHLRQSDEYWGEGAVYIGNFESNLTVWLPLVKVDRYNLKNQLFTIQKIKKNKNGQLQSSGRCFLTSFFKTQKKLRGIQTFGVGLCP
jgi:hypothetical protein